MKFLTGFLIGGMAGVAVQAWHLRQEEESIGKRARTIVEESLIKATGIKTWQSKRSDVVDETVQAEQDSVTY